jgi:protein O-GlcNAc transferase
MNSGAALDRISPLLAAADAEYRCGNRAAAERQCLDILRLAPGHPQALYLLGTLKAEGGDLFAASRYLEQATRQEPGRAAAWVNLGNVRFQQGNVAAAETCHRKALGIDAGLADACFGLGMILKTRCEYAGAQRYFERAIAARPAFGQAYFQLGLAAYHQGELNLALQCYQEALRLDPRMVQVQGPLGVTLQRLGRLEESVAACQRYVREFPQAPAGWNNLGNVQRLLARMDEAAESYRRALAIDPSVAEISNNLGNVLKTLGRLDESVACYRQALQLKPEFVQAHSNLLMCLNYVPDLEEKRVYAEHIRWATRHIPGIAGVEHHANVPEPQRRLRIGYVSPDFRKHAVTCFFERLLANHNRDQVETILYGQAARGDETTRRLQSLSDGWCCTVGMSDAEVASRIRGDGIDILIDLAGHSARNRLPVLGMRPAPVQMSWLGYPNTTGMTAVDYRLTDAIADPPGAENFYTEQLIRLTKGLTCYLPPPAAPECGPLPVLTHKGVTFGSLNNLAKLNCAVIALWSRVLKQAPGSRLLLFRDMLRGEVEERIRREFACHGIGDGRIDLRHELPDKDAYLSVYQSIDIGLDPFPWNGHVTTCEALWMGVPVITLLGSTHRGRLAASVLCQAGLDEMVAKGEDDYIRIAVELAGDRKRLSRLRGGMRGQIADSTLCNGAVFAESVESVYREGWRRWCARQQ